MNPEIQALIDKLVAEAMVVAEARAVNTIHRGFRYKLKPTEEQEELFRQFAGVCRFIYNLALEQRRGRQGED